MHDDTWANFCEIHYESELLLLTSCINFYGTRKCVCTSSNIEMNDMHLRISMLAI